MANASDKKAIALQKLKKAGAKGHQLILLDGDASGQSAADTEETVDVAIDAEASLAWLNGVPMDLQDGKGSADDHTPPNASRSP